VFATTRSSGLRGHLSGGQVTRYVPVTVVAVTELVDRLGMIKLLDAASGRSRPVVVGSPVGSCWSGWRPRSWLGRTSWSGWIVSEPMSRGRLWRRWRAGLDDRGGAGPVPSQNRCKSVSCGFRERIRRLGGIR
jgi:hypothetical protein